MRFNRQITLVPLLAVLASSCATKLPPQSTFSAERWAALQTLKPGTWVQVRYVHGSPPLRQTFEGELRAVSADVLEIKTDQAVQRLLPQRVLRVAIVPRKGNHALALGIMGGLAGGLLAVFWGARTGAETTRMTLTGALLGALLALAPGHGGPKSVVVYSRSGPS